MDHNEILRKKVCDALHWEPLLKTAHLHVQEKKGVIILSGVVNNYVKKETAEHVAKNVSGVISVTDNIHVVLEANEIRSDATIFEVITIIFDWHWDIPFHKIAVDVSNGWVFLSGEVEWNYQKEQAKSAILHLTGIRGITNTIDIISQSNGRLEKRDIEDAISRSGFLTSDTIGVFVCDNIVILKGFVSSVCQKNEVERLAWNAPCVEKVQNDLQINVAI